MRAGSRSSARKVATACSSASAAGPFRVSDNTNTAKMSPFPERSRSRSSRRSGGRTRRISSSRTVIAIAVRGNGGTSVAASATGNTACTGFRHISRITKPISPLARQSPVHGAAPANAAIITSLASVQPPGARTWIRRVPSPVAASSTMSTTRARRAAIREGSGRWVRGGDSKARRFVITKARQ